MGVGSVPGFEIPQIALDLDLTPDGPLDGVEEVGGGLEALAHKPVGIDEGGSASKNVWVSLPRGGR